MPNEYRQQQKKIMSNKLGLAAGCRHMVNELKLDRPLAHWTTRANFNCSNSGRVARGTQWPSLAPVKSISANWIPNEMAIAHRSSMCRKLNSNPSGNTENRSQGKKKSLNRETQSWFEEIIDGTRPTTSTIREFDKNTILIRWKSSRPLARSLYTYGRWKNERKWWNREPVAWWN